MISDLRSLRISKKLPGLKNYLIVLLFFYFGLISCHKKEQISDPLAWALASEHPAIRKVMDSVEQYEVQILYTRIDRENKDIHFTDYAFQVDEARYFYPASTIKFPVAVLALEKLSTLDSIRADTRYYIEGDSIENTFEDDIINIFTVSDNHANNRLLEFLGQDAINSGLLNKGISPVRISHRLGVHSDEVTTQPLVVYINDSTTMTTLPIVNSEPEALRLEGIRKGTGFYDEDSLVREPFDFSLKNYYPIRTQHELLKRVIFPDKFRADEQFRISPAQRDFLLESMQRLPRSAGYDPEVYYDSFCKFFIFGDSKDSIPPNFKIYNKVGFAYGTLTDCAYITDEEKQVEFFLTATILVNKDGIFNDDAYEYENIGIPFLAELGRLLYTYEIDRKN